MFFCTQSSRVFQKNARVFKVLTILQTNTLQEAQFAFIVPLGWHPLFSSKHILGHLVKEKFWSWGWPIKTASSAFRFLGTLISVLSNRYACALFFTLPAPYFPGLLCRCRLFSPASLQQKNGLPVRRWDRGVTQSISSTLNAICLLEHLTLSASMRV